MRPILNDETYNLIEQEVSDGYITKREHDGLTLYNYSRTTEYEQRWNRATRISRGLIIDSATHELISIPFPKFFNYGISEHLHRPIPTHEPIATVKMDGVFATGYNWRGGFQWSTRHNIETPKSLIARQIWQEKYSSIQIPDNICLLAEIIHPETKIIVDYDYIDLVIIGIVDIFSCRDDLRYYGDYCHPELKEFCEEHGLTAVERVDLTLGQAVLLAHKMDANEEGFVLDWGEGFRLKVKSKDYLSVARIKHGMSNREICRVWMENRVEEMMEQKVPEEFRFLVESRFKDLDDYEKETRIRIAKTYATTPCLAKKEAYAESIKKRFDNPMQAWLFQTNEGKVPDVRRHVFVNKLYWDIIGKDKGENG